MSRKQFYTEDQYEQDQLRDDAVEPEDMDEIDDYDDFEGEDGVSDELRAEIDDIAENDVKYTYELLDLLQENLESAQDSRWNSNVRILTVDQWEECLQIMNDLRETMPDAVKRGAWAYNRSDKMVKRAQEELKRHLATQELQFQNTKIKQEKRLAENEKQSQMRADRIIKDASKRANEMVREGVIESRVNEEVKRIRANAQNEVNELRREVEYECMERLNAMSVMLGKMVKEVNGMRRELEGEE